MVLFATSFVLLSTLLAKVNGLQVDTPAGVVTCEPVLIHFGGGTPPYYLSFIPAGQPSAPALKQFPPTQDSGLTWNVDLPPNSAITIMVRDSTGNVAYSDKVSVQSGPDANCAAANAPPLPAAAPPASASQSGASTAASSAASPSASSAPPAAAPAAAGPAASATSRPSQSADTKSGDGSSKNGAFSNHENAFGIMGAMALVVAALAL